MSKEEKSSNQLLENTANLLYNLWDSNSALEYLLQAQTIKEARLGTEDESLGKTYCLLGVVSMNLGKLDYSMKFNQKSLEIDSQCLGTWHVSVAATYKNVGIVEAQCGNFQSTALDLFHKALDSLDIETKSLGRAHVSSASTRVNIANVYQRLGDYEKALFQYNMALPVLEAALGPSHV